MYSPAATVAFVKAVRKFAVQTPDWKPALRYHTLPDERYDITLAALRVYGDRAQFMVILAAAGLDSVEQLLPEQPLVLPNATQLLDIKRQTGYLTDNEARAFASLG
ncbi:hypothetical protein [Burkholderia gladioli]|uniref:hypothetical protein n=1 Tax=Burkholderia gladioli TaxID=28095 RepID=UPI00163F5C8A|nr:hypothetical protein [Burkholderia gladioli]